MTDNNDNSSVTPSNSAAPSASEPRDEAVLALKTSVMADAHDLSDGAKHLAGDAVAHARESAQTQISGGKDRLAEGLGSVAEAIRHTGEQLREGDQSALTEYVARAADGVEAASDYLKEKSIGDVLGDVGSFARREPAMFLGGAFVLGLLGGRFLKSSQVPRSPSTGGASNARASAERQSSNGRQSSSSNSSNSRGKSTPRTPMASGAKPLAAERPRETGTAGGTYRSYDDGAKLPGTV